MAASFGFLVAQMQRWTSPDSTNAADAVLLERFVQRRDESAFAALVARHGGMVLRTCRRILGDAHEAEDAFQATFLILARQASSLKNPHALPGFLHSIARRAALKARAKSAVRARQTPLSEDLPDARTDCLAHLSARELLRVLDEEVARLPTKQRSAVLLCCLEGCTQEEAANQLGCTAGSLRGHLERGRKRLQARLIRRGIALPAALAMVAISRTQAASALLQRGVVQAALHGGAGTPVILAESVLKAMLMSKLFGISAVVLTLALAISVAVGLSYSPAPVEKPSVKAPAAANAPAPLPRVDAQGDPLPAGAIARLGTVRFRHGAAIDFIAFTPDGKRLISRGDDGTRIWDVSTGKELRRLATPSGRGSATDLSPDGRQLAIGIGRTIQFWDVIGEKKTDFQNAKLRGTFRFSPDGKLMAITPKPSEVELWDVAEQKKLHSWKASEARNWFFAFSADSRKLLTSGISGEIRLWDTATGRLLRELRTPDQKRAGGPLGKPVMELSPSGDLLALIEANEKNTASISLRETATGKVLRSLTCPANKILTGENLSFIDLKFTPDGKQLITGGPDQQIRIWDAGTGTEVRRLPLDGGPPGRLALSKDGKMLATVTGAGAKAIRILDLNSGQAAAPSIGHLAPILQVALAPEGRTAVTSSPFEPPLVWDAAAGRVRFRLEGHTSYLVAMQLSGDGRSLFTSGWDKSLRVWDMATGEAQRRTAVEHELTRLATNGLILTPDAKTLAVVDGKNNLRVCDALSGAEKWHSQGAERFGKLYFAANGHLLIAWSDDNRVHVWDTATGRKLHEWPLPRSEGVSYFHFAVSPDCRLLAMGQSSRRTSAAEQKARLCLIDLDTGQIAFSINGLSGVMGASAFSPDGRVLAWTDFRENAIHLLEVASGRERHRFVGHRGEVTALAFSANGERLISGSLDTTALIWDLGRRFDPRHPPAALHDAEVEKLWADLAGEDAARAFQAIRKLAFSPTSLFPFLRKRLRPIPPADEKRIAHLIEELDSEDFAARREATEALEKLGAQPLAMVRRALEAKPSLEKRRRLENLLTKAGRAWWSFAPAQLRALRAIEVLEMAGTKEARELLDALAGGAIGARLTEQAQAARQRLAKPRKRVQ